MKRNYVGVAVVIVSTIGLVLLAFFVRKQNLAIRDLRKELTARTSDDAAAERANMERLIQATAAVGAVADRTMPPQRPSPATADSTPVATPPPKPTLSASQVTHRFDDAFEKEPIAPDWAMAREGALTTRLRSSLPQSSSLEGIECHSSVCRLKTVHENMTALREFLARALRNPESRLTTGAVYSTVQGTDERNRVVAITYVADDGQPLPKVDQM